jgi:sugar lactone lactonase YvrE
VAALLLAMRDGLWRFDPPAAARTPGRRRPTTRRRERFNDGKADPQGRLWVGTIYEPRDAAAAALYRWSRGQLDRMAGDVTVSNGLAWSARRPHDVLERHQGARIYALDFDGADGSLTRQREFAQFAPAPMPASATVRRPPRRRRRRQRRRLLGGDVRRPAPAAPGARRPPAARVPLAGALPDHALLRRRDLRTLFITTARENRPAAELRRSPGPVAC